MTDLLFTGYASVEDGKWTCIACNDSRIRDSLGVIRHDNTTIHREACAHRLMNLRTPRISKSTPASPTRRFDELANTFSWIDQEEQETYPAANLTHGFESYPMDDGDPIPAPPTASRTTLRQSISELLDTPEAQLGQYRC